MCFHPKDNSHFWVQSVTHNIALANVAIPFLQCPTNWPKKVYFFLLSAKRNGMIFQNCYQTYVFYNNYKADPIIVYVLMNDKWHKLCGEGP